MEALAPRPGRPAPAVARQLFAEPRRFSFFQAVRLLSQLHPERTLPGGAGDPRREVVRFRSRPRLDFPAGDLARVEPMRSPADPAELTVEVLSLGGSRGPLPLWVTELLMDRADERDSALADFLDLFHHRLVALLYRARSKYRPQLATTPPDQTPASRALLSLLGLGLPAIRDRLAIPDRALLPYTGLVSPAARSRVGLERLLSGVLEVPVAAQPFAGRFHPLEGRQLTRIGRSGQNQALGRGAVLAYRVWDLQTGARLRVGPVGLKDFLELLPIGRKFAVLQSLARFYTRGELELTLNLVLDRAQVPPLRLGRAGESLLGWNARLLPPAPGPGGEPAAALRLGGAPGARLGWTSWLTGPRGGAAAGTVPSVTTALERWRGAPAAPAGARPAAGPVDDQVTVALLSGAAAA
jgi:type VI secretion system protein ImpH